jgi:hypothetical protein
MTHFQWLWVFSVIGCPRHRRLFAVTDPVGFALAFQHVSWRDLAVTQAPTYQTSDTLFTSTKSPAQPREYLETQEDDINESVRSESCL